MNIHDLLTDPPPPGPSDWNEEGVILLKNFLPEDLMQAYEEAWLRGNTIDGQIRWGGWQYDVPYMHNPEVLDILSYRPLHEVMEAAVGEPMGVHLNLTPWISTQRDWHQDSYLNPGHVGDYYAAVWIALETINPDSGPFQYVPGSHRWPQVTRDAISHFVNINDPSWPKKSEAVLTPFFTDWIEERNAEVVSHLPERGDVLIWHGRLLHRGSPPNIPGTPRRALIAHYSGIHHRPDFVHGHRPHGGGHYFVVHQTPR